MKKQISINKNYNVLGKKINKEYNYDIYDSKDELYNDYSSINNEENMDIIILKID